MRFSVGELVDAMGGRLDHGDVDVDVEGAGIDSRELQAGSVFFALVAERDGHDFVPAAAAAGAGAVVVNRPLTADELQGLPVGVAVVRVDDTEKALAALGRAARSRIDGPVIGITGSVGKTSVKDLTKAACTGSTFGSVWAADKSFNNEIGVPLTLINSPDDVQLVVVEMGARGIGHIKYLCEVARPTIGVVTTVALVHSELFGSIEEVARGKGELIESLPTDGAAVLNADNAHVSAMAERTSAPVLTFGESDDGEPTFTVSDIQLDAELKPTFVVTFEGQSNHVSLEARGAHMAVNATTAIAAAVAAGVAFDDACRQVAAGGLSPWRMEVSRTPTGGVVINDAYNANPTSMRAALEALMALPAARRVAVVGEMAELGTEGEREHLAISQEAVDAGIEVIAVASPAYGPLVRHVDDLDQAAELVGVVGDDTAVVIKASRVAELERLAAKLVDQ